MKSSFFQLKGGFPPILFRVIIPLLLLALFLLRMSREEKPYPSGDAIEYSIMTEAFRNHLTPEIRPTDFDSFKAAYERSDGWATNDKAHLYEAAREFVADKSRKPMEYKHAFFVDTEGRRYSVHFWLYSLLNLPARWICQLFTLNPLLSFHLTNLFLVIAACFVFMTTGDKGGPASLVFCLLFFYSTTYWYFCWPHPEVFTICFASVGLWLFFLGKRHIGILLLSLAAMQNQPLSLLPLSLSLIVLYENGLTVGNLVRLFLCSFWVVLPPLFYYAHFGTTNLIGFQGALSVDHITGNRIRGFFFDLNQGMILALPFILPCYLILYLRKLYYIRSAVARWDMFILPILILIVCGASTIDNWNHGQAVVNRYVTYTSAVILVHFFFLVNGISVSWSRTLLFAVGLFSQIATVMYHQAREEYDWAYNRPKPISDWVLAHFPKWYHPDPAIFLTRYGGGLEMDPRDSPVYFMKDDGSVPLLMVHKDHVSNITQFGFTQHQIDSILPHLEFVSGWAYIDIDEEFSPNASPEVLRELKNERRIKRQIELIVSDPDWYALIKKKAVESGSSEQEVLRRDAAYILHIALPGPGTTREEKIQAKMNEIRADARWLKSLEEKSKQRHVGLDSVIREDATWMVEQAGIQE